MTLRHLHLDSHECPLQVSRSTAAKALLLAALVGATAATWFIALVLIKP